MSLVVPFHLQDSMHHSDELVYEANLACVIAVEVFCAGGKEPGKPQDTHGLQWSISVSKISPFTPTL